MSMDISSPDELERSAVAASTVERQDRRDSSEPVLVPVLGPRWALHWTHLVVTAVFCGVFVFLNHFPLRGTDLWGHLEWGRYVLAEHRLPTEDPLQPLTAGMRVVNMYWLAQVIYAGVERFGGAEALVGLFTLVVWLTYVVMARTCYLQTCKPLLSTSVTMAGLALGWCRISTIRPENFAVLLFVVLLWLLVGRRVRRDESVLADDTRGDWKLWLGVPVIFALWPNLHGSFFCGLALLSCFVAGRFVEVVRQERSLKAALCDREFRRLVYWTELAAVAVLANPYTIDVYIETLRFSNNLNLRDVIEWAPLALGQPGGLEFAAALVATAFLVRHSKRSFAPSDVLALLIFGAGAALQLRMIGWLAAVWAVVMAPHFADVLSGWFAARAAKKDHAAGAVVDADDSDADIPSLPPGCSYRYTLAAAGLIWITFAFSTFSRPLLGGESRSPEALFGDQAPLKLIAFLQKNPPQGQVFNPQYWGDWLAFAGPKPMQLFATTNIHLIPRSVWQDYGRVAGVQSGWDTTLDRYRVQTVIVDRKLQAALGRVLRASPDWLYLYEDEQAQVFRRKPKAAAANAAVVKPAAH